MFLPFKKKKNKNGKGPWKGYSSHSHNQASRTKGRINSRLTHSPFLPHRVTFIVFPPFVSPLYTTMLLALPPTSVNEQIGRHRQQCKAPRPVSALSAVAEETPQNKKSLHPENHPQAV